MKIYKTNAALGHRQYAYLIKVDKDKYLCIGTNTDWQDSYSPGEVNDIEDFYIEDCFDGEYDIKESPLYHTSKYLFNFFLENFKLN